MAERIPSSTNPNFERDGLPIRVFEPEFDILIDETAKQIAEAGESGIDEAMAFRDKLVREVFRLRLLRRTGRQDNGEFIEACQFLSEATWEAIERAKEILVAEGRDWGTQLRGLKAELEQRAFNTS